MVQLQHLQHESQQLLQQFSFSLLTVPRSGMYSLNVSASTTGSQTRRKGEKQSIPFAERSAVDTLLTSHGAPLWHLDIVDNAAVGQHGAPKALARLPVLAVNEEQHVVRAVFQRLHRAPCPRIGRIGCERLGSVDCEGGGTLSALIVNESQS